MSTLTRRPRPAPAAILAAEVLRELRKLEQQENPDRDRLAALLAVADELF